MAKSLSVKQFAALALGQLNPPWHLGYLCWLYNQRGISLKSSLTALSATQTVVFVNAGKYSDLVRDQGGTDVSGKTITADMAVNLYWSQGGTDTVALAALLKPNGVEISYISPAAEGVAAGNVVGLVGTYADLVSLNVTQIPAYPSAWSTDQTQVATQASFLLNELAGGQAFYQDVASQPGNSVETTNPYAQPLAALSPGVSSDTIGTGLLAVVGLNMGVNTTQFMISILASTRNFLLDVLTNTYAKPLPQSVEAVIALIASHRTWIQNALNTVLTDVPPPGEFAVQPGVPVLTVSEVTYELQDGTGTKFTTSALTVSADGTVTGGVTSP
jgi:hypothetical protein